MVATLPANAPPTPPAGGPAAAHGVGFSLVVFPESLRQRWHAVLVPVASPATPLEFATPLDLLRHLAQLTSPPPPSADAAPRDPPTPGGLR
jgi:hypothetical protein